MLTHTHTRKGNQKTFSHSRFFLAQSTTVLLRKESDAVFVFDFFFAPLILTIGRNETNGVVTSRVRPFFVQKRRQCEIFQRQCVVASCYRSILPQS